MENFFICLCTVVCSSGLESILYKSFENKALEYSEKVHLYSVASRHSTEACTFICSSIGCSPHEIRLLQPQLVYMCDAL